MKSRHFIYPLVITLAVGVPVARYYTVTPGYNACVLEYVDAMDSNDYRGNIYDIKGERHIESVDGDYDALKDYKIDHVVHGAIASAAVYGAVLGATIDQIESAIGLVVAHYIPFRAIRHGHQLSDSKGASAAISAEVAVLSMRRAMRGFIGPADIFRNPQAIFCWFQKPTKPNASPFDLALATAGDDFAVMQGQ